MGSKFIALALAGGMIAGLATSCVRPVRAVAVDDTVDFAQYLDTLTDIATGGVLPSGALQVLAAQYALVYAYSQLTDGTDVLHGQAYTVSGFTTYQGSTYFGGGAINDTATYSSIRISARDTDSGDKTTITARRYLTDSSWAGGMTKRAGSRVGLGTSLDSWYINYRDSSASQSFISADWNGEPITNLVIGRTAGRSAADSVYSSSNSHAFFYADSFDFASHFDGLSGTSLPDDLSALHTALQEEYPEVEQQYYLDWDYDPGQGESGCHCNVTVNVEPTINVEVNVEPTINVEVNVENPLPSEWLETIPEETTENPLEELPTLEIENFTDILQEPEEVIGENSGFWWVCLKQWIVDNDKVWKYLLGLFTIAVIGAILRGLG